MTQHALLLSRSAEDPHSTSTLAPSNTSPSDAAPDQGILLTLTLDAAQVSAVVSAVLAESTAGTSDTEKTFSQHRTNIKLVNPKTVSTSATRHSISFSATAGASVDRDGRRPARSSAVEASRPSSTISEPSAETPVFSASSGGIKAVVTRSSTPAIEQALSSSSSAPNPSSAESNSEESSASSPTQSTTNSAADSASSPSNASHSTSSLATSSQASSTIRSNTRVAATSIVAKPVVTNANGIPVVTVYETTGTAFVSATTLSSPAPTPTGAAESKKNFFQMIDSSPTAKALTAIISALIILIIGLAIWLCMRRRSRRPKRRDSLFDFAPDATDVKSAASSYSEKTPTVAAAASFFGTGAAYPFSTDQASFGYDSRYVEAATSTPARSPQQAEEEYRASTSAVRFAGIYPTIPSERRKSSVDLGQVYRLASDYPREVGQDNITTMEETPGISPRDIPTIIVPGSTSPASQQEAWGQAHVESPLAVPPRPARPASLSGSITKNIDEMYDVATPRSSMSVLPPISRPWMRQPRKWASMSSMGGGGPDRRPSVDRRLYQQQLPSRFSITTFATSVEASPDLGAFRPRRTAITEQHLGNSMLRTDIFKAPLAPATNQDANPFSDLAQVAPEHAPVDTPSPMSLSEPWAVTAPLNVQSSALQNEVKVNSSPSASASEQGSPMEGKPSYSPVAASEEGSFEDSLETASQASAIDEEEEEKIRALIKRRQSASSGKRL